MANERISKSRRALLNTTLGLGALGATLPSTWTKPVVNAVMMPAHAMTSPPTTPPPTTPPPPTNPSFSVTKIQSGGPSPAMLEGDVIEYEIVVENTGDVDLTGVVATDTLPDGTVVVLDSPSESLTPDGVLEVGESWTYTTTYTVTVADLLAGDDLINSVSVVTSEVPQPQEDDAQTPVVAVECPIIIFGGVTREEAGSGVTACTLSFTFLSDTTTPLDITDISFTTLPEVISTVSLVDGTTFDGATDSIGPEVVIAFTQLGGACVVPGAITLAAGNDVTFTVEATCEGAVEPITMDFTLSEIAATL